MKKRTLTNRIFTVVTAMVTFVAVSAMNVTTTASASDYDIIGQYIDDYEYEWDNTCEFLYSNENGETANYNFSILYEYTEDDFDELSNLLLEPGKITALKIAKYDTNGDGTLSMTDYVQMYKEIELPSEGFEYEDGGWYPYNLTPKADITAKDIEIVAKILAKIIIPQGGAYCCRYDYNFSGSIDLPDLVFMNQYYSSNPCNFLIDIDGTAIQPEQLSLLLEAADDFGIENFIIKYSFEIVPYSIAMVDGRIYSELDKYTVKPMQIIPRSDDSLTGLEGYLRDDQSDEWSLWRWADEDDNFDDLMWVTASSENVHECLSSNGSFVLIPLDQNGNELGCLFDMNDYI